MAIPVEDREVEPLFTCRVWWKQAIRLLSRNGYIVCSDLQALESECKRYAAQNLRSNGKNKRYLYHVSEHSESPHTEDIH